MSEKGEKKPENAVPSVPPVEGTLTIDLAKLAHLDWANVKLEQDFVSYSNHALVQASPRDIWVDFMTLPGERVDGRDVVRGVRVFMTHIAARRLAESILGVLDQTAKRPDLERFPPPK